MFDAPIYNLSLTSKTAYSHLPSPPDPLISNYQPLIFPIWNLYSNHTCLLPPVCSLLFPKCCFFANVIHFSRGIRSMSVSLCPCKHSQPTSKYWDIAHLRCFLMIPSDLFIFPLNNGLSCFSSCWSSYVFKLYLKLMSSHFQMQHEHLEGNGLAWFLSLAIVSVFPSA